MENEEFESPIQYFDERFSIDAVKLLPGQYFVTSANKMLVTVLGSCIAVCLYDPLLNVGGMNHFMLPTSSNTSEAHENAARYGVYAMELLVNDLIKMGASKKRMKAKVFGGGKVVPTFVQQDVGQINANFIEKYLMAEGITVLASDLRQDYARKIYFFPHDGSVLMKKIHTLKNATIINRESQHRWELSRRASSGSVDLFED
ncbi:chemoreceptor glutamine deamidase CheD [Alteromonas gracilis]|uniref:chemoreceptor glutamine deamidase CheD n=1 Tax=Alteromonas gracilis TaxID=1479524 RepID=UPI003734C817